MYEKKYEFTNETMTTADGHVLHRIRALKDIILFDEDGATEINAANAGDLGGWIEDEDNLSHEGYSWVGDEAMVYGFAEVFENAQVYERAKVFGSAIAFGYARIFGDAKVYDHAHVRDMAIVFGKSSIYGEAVVRDFSIIEEDAAIFGNAVVNGHAAISRYGIVGDNEMYLTFDSVGTEINNVTFYKTFEQPIYVCYDDIYYCDIHAFEVAMKKKYKNTKYETICSQVVAMAKTLIGNEGLVC